MWKKQLNSISPLSINLLRRNRIPSTSIAAAPSSTGTTFQQNPLPDFAPPRSSSHEFLLQDNCFSSKIFSSRAFENQKLQLGLTVQKSKLFCSVSASTSPECVNCWNCNAAPPNSAPFLFCQSCRSVQPVDRSVDFFQILGILMSNDMAFEKWGSNDMAFYSLSLQVHEKFEYWSKAFAKALEQRKNDEALDSIQKMTYYRRAKEEITKKL
ncbi:OLC1v1034013C1 [Oldenlandia corymbosa var. corymbosa]|uniref:OLC1v1034013C1 n=1 Tax=Oldenlandia corymbosa var. corymbosa TaxID=529605 RepID=A0AAV1CPR0_OLDCO|nr:OLC1v1034013C1 [Oldenlandia corymbosa var. corymbosa]